MSEMLKDDIKSVLEDKLNLGLKNWNDKSK